MREGIVFYNTTRAGRIAETDEGYTFKYDQEYFQSKGEPISLTLPLQEKPFTRKTMFSFFDGLIPEGWLLDIAQKHWKIDQRDRMGLLLACCGDTIGAVTVIDAKDAEEAGNE